MFSRTPWGRRQLKSGTGKIYQRTIVVEIDTDEIFGQFKD